MKRFLTIACAAAALSGSLSACASDDFGRYGGRYDAFYDDAYGPFYNGYWARDGFYYRKGPHDRYVRDEGRHFRRDPATGYHSVRGRHDGAFGWRRR